jgi:hypothetical protein
MFASIAAAADAISEALAAVDGVRHYPGLLGGGAIQPPATVLPLPELTWNGPSAEPTDATWVVALVVARDGREVTALWSLLPRVAEALEDVTDVVVTSARFGTYPAGGADLPAYLISVEVAL